MDTTRKKTTEEPINTVNLYLKRTFGRKMAKLALDGGFTCPNRDGTKLWPSVSRSIHITPCE